MSIYLSSFFGRFHKHGMLDVFFILALLIGAGLLVLLFRQLFRRLDFDSAKTTARQNEMFDSFYKCFGKKLDEQEGERKDSIK